MNISTFIELAAELHVNSLIHNDQLFGRITTTIPTLEVIEQEWRQDGLKSLLGVKGTKDVLEGIRYAILDDYELQQQLIDAINAEMAKAVKSSLEYETMEETKRGGAEIAIRRMGLTTISTDRIGDFEVEVEIPSRGIDLGTDIYDVALFMQAAILRTLKELEGTEWHARFLSSLSNPKISTYPNVVVFDTKQNNSIKIADKASVRISHARYEIRKVKGYFGSKKYADFVKSLQLAINN